MTVHTLEGRRNRITDRARHAKPGAAAANAAMILLMVVPVVLGWLAGIAWFAVLWTWAAVVEGILTGWNATPRAGAPPG